MFMSLEGHHIGHLSVSLLSSINLGETFHWLTYSRYDKLRGLNLCKDVDILYMYLYQSYVTMYIWDSWLNLLIEMSLICTCEVKSLTYVQCTVHCITKQHNILSCICKSDIFPCSLAPNIHTFLIKFLFTCNSLLYTCIGTKTFQIVLTCRFNQQQFLFSVYEKINGLMLNLV